MSSGRSFNKIYCKKDSGIFSLPNTPGTIMLHVSVIFKGICSRKIQQNFGYTKRHINPDLVVEEIQAIAADIFSDSKLAELSDTREKHRKTDRLLKHILRKGEGVCKCFLKCLQSESIQATFILEDLRAFKDKFVPPLTTHNIDIKDIHEHFEDIVKELENTDIIDPLLEYYVLDLDEHDTVVYTDKPNRERNSDLVNILCKKESADWIPGFILVLKDKKYVLLLSLIEHKGKRAPQVFPDRVLYDTTYKMSIKFQGINASKIEVKLARLADIDNLCRQFAKLSVSNIKQGSVLLLVHPISPDIWRKSSEEEKQKLLEEFIYQLIYQSDVKNLIQKEIDVSIEVNEIKNVFGDPAWRVKNTSQLTKEQQKLEDNWTYLVEEMEVKKIMEYFIERDVMTVIERQKIMDLPGRRERANIFLSILKHKLGEVSIEDLIDGLVTTGQTYIGDRLKKDILCIDCLREIYKDPQNYEMILDEMVSSTMLQTVAKFEDKMIPHHILNILTPACGKSRRDRAHLFMQYVLLNDEVLRSFENVLASTNHVVFKVKKKCDDCKPRSSKDASYFETSLVEEKDRVFCSFTVRMETDTSKWSKFEQKKVLPGLKKNKAGHFGVDRPKTVDGSLFGRNSDEENKSDNFGRGQALDDDSSNYYNVELKDSYVEAIHDFEERRPGEITIRTGDIITLLNKQEDGNMRGRLGKCEGLFPSLHVKSYEKTEKDKRLRIVERMVVDTTVSDTLDLKVGCEVGLINKAGYWYWVENREKEGWIPVHSADFVSNIHRQERSDIGPVLPPRPKRCNSSNMSTKTNQEYVEAQCDNKIDGVDILKFVKGDIITVTDRKSDGFMYGRIGTEEGKFPVDYIKPFENNPERQLKVVSSIECNYDDILKVQPGNIVTLKNKYSENYWVEFKGNEGWVPVTCVDFVTKDEDSPPPKPPRKESNTDVGLPLPPKPPKEGRGNDIDNKNEIRIIMLGKTGSGKSATGNSIVGEGIFKSHICEKSVTKKCEKYDGICNGKRLVVIDTPGLFDTTLSHDAISGEIIRCAHLSLPGPHVFLIVLQITRFTNEETVALEQLFDIFGTSMGKYSLIVFTRSEELEREGKSIKSFIEEAGSPLTDFIRKCKDRYIAINNTATGSSKAERVTNLVMAISEIVKDNNGDHFTNQIIDEANREALVLQELQKSFVKQDNDEEEDFDEEEHDTISLDSHDSGVSMPNQPIYDEAYGEYDMKETELKKLIDKTDREIRNNEAIKSNLQELNEKDVKNIDFQLTKKRKEVIDIKADLNSMLNQCRTLEQQKVEIKNKTKIAFKERDLQLKQLHKRKIKLAKQKCNHAQQKMKLRQNISKESDSLQTKLNTPQNGCLIM